MKIAVLGVGHIGSAVGPLWHSAGHETTFAGRDESEPRDLAAELGARARAHVATVADAAAGAGAVLMASPARP
jgi:predicted dinucleotide-binding enzyme